MLEDPFQDSEENLVAPQQNADAPSPPAEPPLPQRQQKAIPAVTHQPTKQPHQRSQSSKKFEKTHAAVAPNAAPPPMPLEEKKPPEKTKEEIQAEERAKARDVEANQHQIKYSSTYYDEAYAYRHVKLPKVISRWLPHYKPMKEAEWRTLGVQQSSSWEHYMVHAPEPHILLFRERLDTHKARMRERERRQQLAAAAQQEVSENPSETSRPSKRQKADQ